MPAHGSTSGTQGVMGGRTAHSPSTPQSSHTPQRLSSAVQVPPIQLLQPRQHSPAPHASPGPPQTPPVLPLLALMPPLLLPLLLPPLPLPPLSVPLALLVGRTPPVSPDPSALLLALSAAVSASKAGFCLVHASSAARTTPELARRVDTRR